MAPDRLMGAMPHSPLPLLPAGPDCHGPVVVGFSGGLDSTVLLHALAHDDAVRSRGLRAVHVDHALQTDSPRWAEACATFCDALGIGLQALCAEVIRDAGEGLEAAARHARHGVFLDQLATGDVLALAHHQDDQAETFLLRALRASGPDGLAAMRPWRPFGSGWLWRPLLDTPRARILAYAHAHGLSWIEDPSNTDTALDRNFLRQRVLPMLRERWPHADAALSRSAALCADAHDLLADGDAEAMARVTTVDPHCLSIDALMALPMPRRARVLRQWIVRLGLPPLPANGVARIETEVIPAGHDAGARFEWQDAAVRRWRGLLHAGRPRPPLPPGWQKDWDGRAPLPLPGGGELSLHGAYFDPPCRVGARQGGERIRLPGRTHSHALKHVLQDLDVPPWVRERLPLLFDADDELLAAGDVTCSASFDAWLRAHDARLRWTDAMDRSVTPHAPHD
jgi:tRNA(Ile)-lysidine synthase